VRELGFLPERHGVYISRWHHGSPSHRFGLWALHFVHGAPARPALWHTPLTVPPLPLVKGSSE
jgi:hypothetical protein